jgi:hypothetical protein
VSIRFHVPFDASVDVTGERNSVSQIACGVSDRSAQQQPMRMPIETDD